MLKGYHPTESRSQAQAFPAYAQHSGPYPHPPPLLPGFTLHRLNHTHMVIDVINLNGTKLYTTCITAQPRPKPGPPA